MWHDGDGACLFVKRLERGRFLWPYCRGRRCDDLGRATILFLVRHRLANAAENLASHGVWMICGGLTQWSFRARFLPLNLLWVIVVTSPQTDHPLDGLPDALPNDLASAHAMILAQRAMLAEREAALIKAQNEAKVCALEIERLKLQLAKARREHSANRRNAASSWSSNSNWRSKTWRKRKPRKRPGLRSQRPRPPRLNARRPQRGPRKLPDNLPVEGASLSRPLAPAASAAAPGCANSVKSSPRRWNASGAGGRSSSTCARSSPAGIAKLISRAASALAPHPARLCRPEPAGHDLRRQVRGPPATEPAKRRLCA